MISFRRRCFYKVLQKILSLLIAIALAQYLTNIKDYQFQDQKIEKNESINLRHYFVQAVCSQSDVSAKSSLTFQKSSSFQMQISDYLNYQNCQFQTCSCTSSPCSLIYVFSTSGDIGKITATDSNLAIFNSQQSPCLLSITCTYGEGTTASYTITAIITISSTSVISASSCTQQNSYKLTNSSSQDYFYMKGTVPYSVPATLGFVQSPSTTCQFTSCSLYNTASASNQYSPSSFVTFTTGTINISSQTINFVINPSTAQNKLSLFVGCLVPSSVASTAQAFTVFSSNQFNFLVCDYTKVSQSDTTLQLNQNGQVTFTNTLIQPSSIDCKLSSCQLIQSSNIQLQTNPVSFIWLSGTSQFQITFSTSQLMSDKYYIQCNGIAEIQQQSQVFKVSVVCSSSILIFGKALYSANLYFQKGSMFVSFSNFSTNDTNCPIESHKIVISQSNSSSPSGFSIVEGTSSFQVEYSLIGGSPSVYNFYILASASGGAVLYRQIQISVQCGPNSVSIGTPSAFRQTQTFMIGQQSVFTYSNFTSNDTRCPIIKHSLVESKLNQSSPSQFNITEGNSQFSIDYILNGGIPSLYNFFVKVQALGGATFYKQIFIQSLTYYDCSQDSISMIQAMPDKSKANFKLFSVINSFPSLKLNQSLGNSFQADISSRYKNAYGSSCTLNYLIEQVSSQGNVVSSSDYSTIFKLSQSGQFQVQLNADQPINNYQVYIKVCNQKICFSDLQHYVLDITLFKKVVQVKNITFDTIRKGSKPYFVKDPQNITINIAKTFGNYIQYLPEVSKDTSRAFIKQTSEDQAIDILFNKLNASLIFYQKNFQKTQTAYVQVTLKNDLAFTTDYNITVIYIDFNPKNVSATIKKIDQLGLMTIYFNDSMVLNDSIPWINYSSNETVQLNKSWINSSNTNIYLQPANHREQDANFNQSQIDFNWNVVSITNKTIIIQLNFTNPYQISPQVTQDKIIVQFNGSQYLLMSSNTKQNLHPLYWTFSSPVMKQMPNDHSTQTFLATIASGQTLVLCLLVLGIIFNFLGDKVLNFMRLMIRSLQLILHLPIMQVSLPANVVAFINDAISFVMFDIFFNKTVWSYIPYIYFNENIQAAAMNQMQNVGYCYRNAFQGLAAVTFFVYLYFLRLFLSFVFKILVLMSDKKSKLGKQILWFSQIMSKGIFFNQILGLSLEAYMEFFINSLLNIQTADFSTNGEWLGISLSYFSATMIHGVLPLLMIFIITRKQKELINTPFGECAGELFENTKIDSRVRLAYTLIFIVRRGLYLTLGMFILDPNLGGIQIACLMFLNLLAIIYIGYASAQKRHELNFIEFVNEIFVQAATVHLVLFADFVQDSDVQFMYGWYMIACISFVFVFNFYFVFREIGKILCKYILKYFNLIQFYFDKKTPSKTEKTIEQQIQEQIKQKEAFEKIIQMQRELFLLKTPIKLKSQEIKAPSKVQNLNKNQVDPKEIAQMIGQKYTKKQKAIEKQNWEQQHTQDSLSKEIEEKPFQKLIPPKIFLNQNQIQLNNEILKKQRKYFQDKSIALQQKQKRNKESRQKQQEDRREFLKNVRTQRMNQEQNNHDIIIDRRSIEFKNFIEKYDYILESCSNKFNSFEDLKKDIAMFVIEERDSVQQLAFKEHQLIEFIQNIIFFKSTLKNPFLDFSKFKKDLNNFIEQKIQFK